MSALDGLAAEDLFGLSAAGLLDRTAVLVAARNRIDAELARTVRRAELAQAPEHDGLKTMASWLRGHARLSPAAAGQLVRNGRALESLPAVAAGCSAGLITAEQVGVLAPVTRPETLTAAADQGVELPRSISCWPRSPPPGSTGSSAGWWATIWPGWTPTDPNPTPPKAGHSRWPATATARSRCASNWTRWAGRTWPPRWSPSCRPTGRPATGAPAPSSWATHWCNWPMWPWPPAGCRCCARSSRR